MFKHQILPYKAVVDIGPAHAAYTGYNSLLYCFKNFAVRVFLS